MRYLGFIYGLPRKRIGAWSGLVANALSNGLVHGIKRVLKKKTRPSLLFLRSPAIRSTGQPSFFFKWRMERFASKLFITVGISDKKSHDLAIWMTNSNIVIVPTWK